MASVITKGGTVVNPFNMKLSNQNLKQKKPQVQRTKQYNYDIDDEEERISMPVFAGERGIDGNSCQKKASHTNVRFDAQSNEGADGPASGQRQARANAQMVQVYLQAPYKVLTIDEINKKKREEEDPQHGLYPAENSLQIHTALREGYMRNQALRTTAYQSKHANAADFSKIAAQRERQK